VFILQLGKDVIDIVIQQLRIATALESALALAGLAHELLDLPDRHVPASILMMRNE
jgi:hypothetical protein